MVYYQKNSTYSELQLELETECCVDDIWHHVAFVYDPSINKFLLYFNEILYYTIGGFTVENYLRNTCWIGRSIYMQ